MRVSVVAALALSVFILSGCAMITGTVTGAFTNAVDAPAETYRHNCKAFHDYPILYGCDALVMGPVGIVTGPVFGFVKGLSLDVEWVTGKISYGTVFGTYQAASIWRPYTIQWHSQPDACCGTKETSPTP